MDSEKLFRPAPQVIEAPATSGLERVVAAGSLMAILIGAIVALFSIFEQRDVSQERSSRIETRLDRIESKLDRLIETRR